MSDELEQKRQEKIANFKLNFNYDSDDDDDISSSSEEEADNAVELCSSGDDDAPAYE